MKRVPLILLYCSAWMGLAAGVSAQVATQQADAVPVVSAAAASVAPAASPEQAQGQRAKAIYYFEHRFIPKFVYTTEGRFFDDLIDNDGKVLKKAAAKIVDEAFAAELKITTIDPGKAVLITFAAPTQSLQCYYAIVAKTDTGYSYTTLEKAMDLGNAGKVKAMYCGWSADGVHQNFGPRSYDAKEDFVKEFLSSLATGAGVPQASFRPGN